MAFMKSFWDRTRADESGPSRRSLIARHPILFRSAAVAACIALGAFLYVYFQYAKLIEDKLGDGGLRTNSTIYRCTRRPADG